MKTKQLALSAISASLLAGLLGVTSIQAAEVPAGVKLAKEQTLVRGNGTEPASLDPQRIEGVPGGNIARDLFEGLVNDDPKKGTVPGVAESWTANKDKTVYTFKLRKDAKWSNGEPVTAHDFVFAFQRAVDPKLASNYSWYIELAEIKNASEIIKGKKKPSELGVRAVDDRSFEVTINKPLPYFVKMMSHYTTFPVHRKTVEKYGEKWTLAGNMVSNGAYKLKEWVVNERIILERNKAYWNNKETVINQVSFLPIQSNNTELNRYRAGEIDMSYDSIALEHFRRLQKEIPDEVKVTGKVGTYYYVFNTRKKPFDDVRVRKALSLAIDREVITDRILGQGQLPTFNFTPNNVDGFTPPANPYSKMTQKERLDQAIKLLKETGYDKNNPLKLTLLYNTDDNHKKLAIAISSMWKKSLGVQVTLENQEWKTYLDNKRLGNFEVARAGWIGDYNEASTMLDLLTTDNALNDSKYNNKEYDQLLAKAKTADDPSQYYTKAEALITRDMPVATIYQYVTPRLVKPYVGGYQVSATGSLYTRDFYIIAQK
ncbi:ABC transporter substrate-binding protein [Spartinivicinus ruber]|uniref:ABC transporter substrate-binding protein n=1 Tax=Spartinivicinus ruber TaxID=2683272 RepID=UPI0013D6F760|nr:ABC transporter substrate-binding protein [Spartinivicinus ruber]